MEDRTSIADKQRDHVRTSAINCRGDICLPIAVHFTEIKVHSACRKCEIRRRTERPCTRIPHDGQRRCTHAEEILHSIAINVCHTDANGAGRRIVSVAAESSCTRVDEHSNRIIYVCSGNDIGQTVS